MIPVEKIYLDVLDAIDKDQNGEMDFELFNRMSRRAELRLLDYLTGNVTGQVLPIAYSSQKSKDLLSDFITPFKTSLDSDGRFSKPDDYYYYDNMFSLTIENVGCDVDVDCDTDINVDEVKNNVITLLNGDRFNKRKNTYIQTLKPTPEKAIAKEVGTGFEIYPASIPGVYLEYIAFPEYAEIVGAIDTTYNTPIVNTVTSTNYKWNEGATEMLVYFISDSFFNRTSFQAGKQMGNASNQLLAGK